LAETIAYNQSLDQKLQGFASLKEIKNFEVLNITSSTNGPKLLKELVNAFVMNEENFLELFAS
jgi:hypothetical protein